MKKLSLFLILFFLFPISVKANGGFVVSPPFQDVVIGKDDVDKKVEIELKNESDKQEIFKLSAIDFGSMDESGGLMFLGGNQYGIEKKYALASWMVLEKDSLILDPGTSRKLKITIVNKDSLSPGGHYGALMITLDSSSSEKDIVNFNQAYASLLFVKKQGGEISDLSLNKMDFKRNFFRINKKIEFEFKNGGNVHLVPRGKVDLIDPFNRLVYRGIINSESSIILPESYRIYKSTLKNIKNVFVPGIYKIRIDTRYDGSDNYINKEIRFFYLGWFWTLVIAFPFVVLIWKNKELISGVVEKIKAKNKRDRNSKRR